MKRRPYDITKEDFEKYTLAHLEKTEVVGWTYDSLVPVFGEYYYRVPAIELFITAMTTKPQTQEEMREMEDRASWKNRPFWEMEKAIEEWAKANNLYSWYHPNSYTFYFRKLPSEEIKDYIKDAFSKIKIREDE